MIEKNPESQLKKKLLRLSRGKLKSFTQTSSFKKFAKKEFINALVEKNPPALVAGFKKKKIKKQNWDK